MLLRGASNTIVQKQAPSDSASSDYAGSSFDAPPIHDLRPHLSSSCAAYYSANSSSTSRYVMLDLCNPLARRTETHVHRARHAAGVVTVVIHCLQYEGYHGPIGYSDRSIGRSYCAWTSCGPSWTACRPPLPLPSFSLSSIGVPVDIINRPDGLLQKGR